MGSLLLAAGEKGKRHCLPNASIMIHREYRTFLFVDTLPDWRLVEPSGGASGQASDIAIHAKEILRVRRLLTEIYQKHCAKSGESEAEGLARFGDFEDLASLSNHSLFTIRTSVRARLLYDRFGCSFSRYRPMSEFYPSPGSHGFRNCRWHP